MKDRSAAAKALLIVAECIFALICVTSFAEAVITTSAAWILASVGALCACMATALVSNALYHTIAQAAKDSSEPSKAAMPERDDAADRTMTSDDVPAEHRDAAVAADREQASEVHHDDGPKAAPAAAPLTDEAAPAVSEPKLETDAQPEADAQPETTAQAAANIQPEESENATGELAVPSAVRQLATKRATTSTLDYEGLLKTLTSTNDPIGELKLFVGDIRTRQARHKDANRDGSPAEGKAESMPVSTILPTPDADEDVPAPSELELFAARELEEAGLFANDVELPPITVVVPKLSQMIYLRTSGSMTYLAKLRIIKLESALNAVRFACNYFDDRSKVTMEDCYRMMLNLTSSICAQVPDFSTPMEMEDGDRPDGEWSVRRGISKAIESFTLPFRLTASFRTNVADGNVAIRLDLTPEQAFPSSQYVEGLGVVPSTRDMRHKQAGAYALRLALLVAHEAFRTSAKIKHVWVQGVIDTGSRSTCYLCVDFDRWRFSRIDMQKVDDLPRIYRSFCPEMRYEDGILKPVRATFSIEEERFCPIRRYIPVSLSRRKLPEPYAEALGTDHVSGLAIEEADKRSLIASDIMRGIEGGDQADATEHNVRTILDAAGDDPDPTVRSAAERCVNKLIDGTLPDDALAVADEFVEGDALSQAARRGRELLEQGHQDEAIKVLSRVLTPLDNAGTYADSPLVQYRYFGNYLDRALYNRLYAKGASVLLVPDAYYEAELMLAMSLMTQDDHEGALKAARRVVEIAPLDMRANLNLVRCLETMDRPDECIAELKHLLTIGHDPQTLALAYYRLAFFEWSQGSILAAQACYECALHFVPQGMSQISLELTVLTMQNPDTVKQDITSEQVVQILKDNDIPVAPTENMISAFYDATRASVDAEIFPVARNFVNALGAFTGDDVIFGIIRSMEDEPDR